MTWVIDASVAAKWFLREDLRAEALQLFDHEYGLLAPDWIVQEIAHVAFKKWRDAEIEAAHARAMVQSLPSYLSELYPSMEFAEHALDIALTLHHPVYDCIYLACAEFADGIMITADKGLCAAVEGTEFAGLVRHLGDMTFPETGDGR